MTDELGRWDAVETRDRLREGDVSAAEVIDAAIARAEAARDLNAVVTDSFAHARARAGRTSGLLAGVPTFIKDLARTEGVRTRWGTLASGHHVPTKSDPIVSTLEATGLVSLGKSATPELGLTGTTEPLGMPPCRNPHDPERSTGGSSGGAGALVAAGVVPIAHGSDGGGSIRIPASCNGVVGLKVSRGRLDMEGSNLLPVNVAVDGCLTRTVRDTVAFWEAVAPAGPSMTPRDEPPKLRIAAFSDAPTGTPVHADHRRAVHDAAEACRAIGHQVTTIPSPFEGRVIDDFLLYWRLIAWGQKVGARLLMHRRFDASKLDPWTKGLAASWKKDPLAVMQATRRLRRFGARYEAVMRDYDVVLSPVTAAPPPVHGWLAPDQPFERHFDRLRTYLPFTAIQNVAGAPALSLPLGKSEGGMPVGVQLAGRVNEERTLLGLGLALERSIGFAP
ncbi:MAG: amidase [Deltaproteobacteria bacterium]|nr:amidase [Deltaproteobacteria bacterium]